MDFQTSDLSEAVLLQHWSSFPRYRSSSRHQCSPHWSPTRVSRQTQALTAPPWPPEGQWSELDQEFSSSLRRGDSPPTHETGTAPVATAWQQGRGPLSGCIGPWGHAHNASPIFPPVLPRCLRLTAAGTGVRTRYQIRYGGSAGAVPGEGTGTRPSLGGAVVIIDSRRTDGG